MAVKLPTRTAILHQREDVGKHIAALPKNKHAAPEW